MQLNHEAIRNFIFNHFTHEDLILWSTDMKRWPNFRVPSPYISLNQMAREIVVYFECQGITPVLLNFIVKKRPDLSEELTELGWDGGQLDDPMEWYHAGKLFHGKKYSTR